MKLKLTRRGLFQAAGSLVVAAGVSRSPVLAAPLGAYPFTLGVASGDPWPDGFVIWTRLAPRPLDEHGGMPAVLVPVSWEVAEDEGFSRVVRKGQALARPELAHSVHVEVTGLRSARPYWYRFSVAGSGEVSPVGRVKTAPAADAAVPTLRIAVGGCDNWQHGYFNAWAAMAREPDLDLVFHYGDYIYEGKSLPLGPRSNGRSEGLVTVRQHLGDEIYSLDDYRRRHAQYKTDPDLQAIHRVAAFAVSFDDHEVDNNWAGDIDEHNTAPEIFVLRRFAALQAWYEHMPVRRAQFPTLHGLTAYRRLDYGRLLRMHVLDTRSYRTDQPCDDGKIRPCPPEAHASYTMMGSLQESWLDEGLGNDATWNLLAHQVLVMPFDFRKPGATEPAITTDTWDGYRPARARLVDAIRRHGLTNVVNVTGDFHKNFVGTVPEREDALDGRQAAVEFLSTSISSQDGPVATQWVDTVYANNPHIRLHDDDRGYHVHEITPKTWTATVTAVDQVLTRGGRVSKRTQFVVTPDQAAVHKA